MRRLALLALLAALLGAGDAAAATGDLTGLVRCATPERGGGCDRLRPGAGRGEATGWSAAPDGRGAVGTVGERAVVALRRDPRTGALRQVAGRGGCVAVRAGAGCGVDARLDGALLTAVSPDGRFVAVQTEAGPDDVDTLTVVLPRDPRTGALRPGGAGACVATLRTAGCTRVPGPGTWGALAWGPEGRSLYSAGGSDLQVLAVDPATGALTPGTCFTQPANRPTPGCTAAPGLEGDSGAEQVLVPQDGRALYVRAPGRDTDEGRGPSLAAFARDPATGALTAPAPPGGCYGTDVEDPPAPRVCTSAPFDRTLASLVAVGDVLLADGVPLTRRPDGTLAVGRRPRLRGLDLEPFARPVVAGRDVVYATGLETSSGQVFAGEVTAVRVGAGGAVSQPAGRGACVSGEREPACAFDRTGFPGATALALGPGGRHVYVLATADRAVRVVRRDPRTGALRPRAGGCVGRTARGCRRGPLLRTTARTGSDLLLADAGGRTVTVLGGGVWSLRRAR